MMTFPDNFEAAQFFLSIEGVTSYDYINDGLRLSCSPEAVANIKGMTANARKVKNGVKIIQTSKETFPGTCTFKSVSY